MLYALNDKKEKIKATPKSNAICPMCDAKVISKCGQIKIWHWSHESLKDCDSFGEDETYWHIKWKLMVDKQFCEVKIKNHRADIFNGVFVIELQNQSLDVIKISEREEFYDKMIWIFNAQEFKENIEIRDKGNYVTFRWKYPRHSIGYCGKQVYLDFGSYILQIKFLDTNIPAGGWGHILSKEKFCNIYLKDVLKDE